LLVSVLELAPELLLWHSALELRLLPELLLWHSALELLLSPALELLL
jgi:hypothetical protein